MMIAIAMAMAMAIISKKMYFVLRTVEYNSLTNTRKFHCFFVGKLLDVQCTCCKAKILLKQ